MIMKQTPRLAFATNQMVIQKQSDAFVTQESVRLENVETMIPPECEWCCRNHLLLSIGMHSSARSPGRVLYRVT